MMPLASPPWSADLCAEAWMFATRKHAGQTYGGPTEGVRIDYINHVGSVAMEVMWALAPDGAPSEGREAFDPDLAILCALLHDTIEDTDATVGELAGLFGHRVAAGVSALTKDATIADAGERMLDSLARIERQPREVWMVKLADRITNLVHPPWYWSLAKRAAYREEGRLILARLGGADARLAARLQGQIDRYARFL